MEVHFKEVSLSYAQWLYLYSSHLLNISYRFLKKNQKTLTYDLKA